jgi:hypothetical protein
MSPSSAGQRESRRENAAATGSQVIIIIITTTTAVCPELVTQRRSRPGTSALAREARLPTGSPADPAARLTGARAIATRGCWPPGNSPRRRDSRPASPTASTPPQAETGWPP